VILELRYIDGLSRRELTPIANRGSYTESFVTNFRIDHLASTLR
jgi:hypothetical protein